MDKESNIIHFPKVNGQKNSKEEKEIYELKELGLYDEFLIDDHIKKLRNELGLNEEE